MLRKICIDPGHGGFDPGATFGNYRECDINLTIALQLQSLLEAAGIEVVMTRTTDVSPWDTKDKQSQLSARCQIANDAKVDLFLAIHTNAMGDGQQAHGMEAYVFGAGTDIHGLVSDICNNIGKVMGFHGEPIKDGSGLYVIKHTHMPSMLLEVGFIDSSDNNLIQANINNFAGWIAKPLIPWLGGNTSAASPALVNDYAGSSYENAIDWVKSKGYMVGYTDQKFAPNDTVTRGQLASILFRALGGEVHESTNTGTSQ